MATAVRALREKLGDEAMGGLQTFVDDARREWKNEVLTLATERFDRRLGEEIGALRLDIAKELATLRVETAKEFASAARRDGRDTLRHVEVGVRVLDRPVCRRQRDDGASASHLPLTVRLKPDTTYALQATAYRYRLFLRQRPRRPRRNPAVHKQRLPGDVLARV